MKKYLQILGVLIFLFSCNSQPKLPSKKEFPLFYKVTFEYDKERVQIGLPPISEKLKLKWFTNNCYTEYFAYCIDFESKDTTYRPRLDLKSIITDTTGICKEKNVFIGPNYEQLVLFYGFKKYYDMNADSTGLGFHYTFKEIGKKRNTISKNQADSILLRWAFQIF